MKFCVGEKMSEVSGQYEVVSCQYEVVSGQLSVVSVSVT